MTTKEKNPNKPLYRRELANTLIHRMLNTLREEEAYTQPVTIHSSEDNATKTVPLYAALGELIDVIWLPRSGKPSQQEKQRRRTLLQDLSEVPITEQHTVIDFMAHAGQLHQMAGLLARESLLSLTDEKDKLHPVRRLLFTEGGQRKYMTPEIALAAIAKPSFEMTFTGHPTNTNSVASMKTQRELAAAIIGHATNQGLSAYRAATEALKKFAITPLLPERGGVPTPLTVGEETQTMLYFLGNAYDDLPQTYSSFDSELARAYGDRYQPQDLKLGIKFHSWGSSGDKDGNGNVNADTTLMAIAGHKCDIMTRYVRDLNALQLPGMEEARKQLTEAATCATSIVHMADVARKMNNGIPSHMFDEFSTRLKHTSDAVDLPKIMGALEQAYGDAPPEKQQPILDLLRRMRTFGTGFGTIEYRETAEEYTRILERFVPGYASLNEQQRCATLTALIEDPQKLGEMATAFQGAMKDYACKPYDKTDAGPIAYQTLKRMELARDFPDTVQNNVLAECKNTSNMLEALVLQHAVMKDGKRAMLGIVPLFEEHETLKAAPEIVRRALDNPAYKTHLDAVAGAQGHPPAQQIQLAHSDNAKRAGVPAARALIFAAHENLRGMMQQFNKETGNNIAIQFFEGGSQSDIYRGGGRAISAAVNAYGLHHFAKMTFQGGDLLNFFNLPAATTRLLTHNLANCVNGGSRAPRQMSRRDHQIVSAFDNAKISYIERMFEDPRYVEFLNHINYAAVVEAGNFSSRAGARGGKSKQVEKIDSTRAIGISETLQHADFVATWVGVRHIEQLLENAIEGTNSPRMRRALYEESPIYRHIIDNMLMGLVRTDLRHVDKLSRDTDGREHPLMQEFRDQYAEAFKLCMESYTGQSVGRFVKGDLNDPATVANMVNSGYLRLIMKQQVYPHVMDTLGDQERFVEMAHCMEQWKKPDDKIAFLRPVNNSLIHNMLDTIHHGRVTLIDDPTYARVFCKHSGIPRPWVKENGNGQAQGSASMAMA